MSTFFKERNGHEKVMGLFVGVPCPEMMKEDSAYIRERFGSRQLVRLSLGSRKVDLGRST